MNEPRVGWGARDGGGLYHTELNIPTAWSPTLALKPRSVPQDRAYRDAEIDHLAATLDPLTAENVSIFGPSGAGKTTLVKYVLGRLERDRVEYRWGYHNCMSESSTAGALHSLVRNARLGRDLRRNGASTGTYIDRVPGVCFPHQGHSTDAMVWSSSSVVMPRPWAAAISRSLASENTETYHPATSLLRDQL